MESSRLFHRLKETFCFSLSVDSPKIFLKTTLISVTFLVSLPSDTTKSKVSPILT